MGVLGLGKAAVINLSLTHYLSHSDGSVMVCERGKQPWNQQMDGKKKGGEKRLTKRILNVSTIEDILKRCKHHVR